MRVVKFGKFSHLVVSSMLCVPHDLFRSPAMLSFKFIRKRAELRFAIPKPLLYKGNKVLSCTVESDERGKIGTQLEKACSLTDSRTPQTS